MILGSNTVFIIPLNSIPIVASLVLHPSVCIACFLCYCLNLTLNFLTAFGLEWKFKVDFYFNIVRKKTVHGLSLKKTRLPNLGFYICLNVCRLLSKIIKWKTNLLLQEDNSVKRKSLSTDLVLEFWWLFRCEFRVLLAFLLRNLCDSFNLLFDVLKSFITNLNVVFILHAKKSPMFNCINETIFLYDFP